MVDLKHWPLANFLFSQPRFLKMASRKTTAWSIDKVLQIKRFSEGKDLHCSCVFMACWCCHGSFTWRYYDDQLGTPPTLRGYHVHWKPKSGKEPGIISTLSRIMQWKHSIRCFLCVQWVAQINSIHGKHCQPISLSYQHFQSFNFFYWRFKDKRLHYT